MSELTLDLHLRVTKIDDIVMGDRIRESFWQHEVDTHTPRP